MKAPKDHYIIQIEVTNACVHTCSNCTRFCGMHKKPFFMEYDTFCKAVDSIIDHPGIIGVMGGEPTLHPRFEDMCEYLYSRLEEKKRVKLGSFALPTDNYIDVRRHFEQMEYEIFQYSDEPRVIMQGAGLWTSMTSAYQKYMETIQDIFNFQSLNDHNNASYHQPVLVSRKDLGISDKKWIKMRENCWVNQQWSSSITPKGCFFCEVAAALDYLFDGPGGLPIEQGWWKRDIKDFENQFHWCELCGIPLKTFSRDAREGITDVSESNYKKLKNQSNVKIRDERIKIVSVENGKVRRFDEDTSKYRSNAYVESAQDRLSADNAIFAQKFSGVLITDDEDTEATILEAIKANQKLFEWGLIIQNKHIIKEFKNGKLINILENDNISEKELLDKFEMNTYIILFTSGIRFGRGIEYLKRCVVNPGTLHYAEYTTRDISNDYIKEVVGERKQYVALLNNHAKSLKYMNLEEEVTEDIFSALFMNWQSEKRIAFNSEMDLLMYSKDGVKKQQGHFHNAVSFVIRFIKKYGFWKVFSYASVYLKHHGISFIMTKIKYRFF